MFGFFPGELESPIAAYLRDNPHPTLGMLLLCELKIFELWEISSGMQRWSYIIDVVPTSVEEIEIDYSALLTVDEETWFNGLENCCTTNRVLLDGSTFDNRLRVRLADECYKF